MGGVLKDSAPPRQYATKLKGKEKEKARCLIAPSAV